MGRNKLQKFRDNAVFKSVVEPDYRELLGSRYKFYGNWRRLFFGNNNPIYLELGCGKGEYAVQMAENNPGINFIGIDVKGARIWHGAKYVEDNNIKNVAFIRTNIEFLPSLFAEDEVSSIWITFPDPQMKYKRRRLFSSRFLNIYKNILIFGGAVNLKTDSPFLIEYVKRFLAANNSLNYMVVEDIHKKESYVKEELSIITYYERQWIERDLPINYVFLKNIKTEFKEIEDKDIQRDIHRSFGRIKLSD